MNRLEIPEFTSYDEEAAFWDNLDTGDFMQDDGKWFRFETPTKRAVRIAVLPDIAEALAQRAHAQGVAVETLVNVLLAESMSKPVTAG
jgi:predicted DNA binding CopG/RHH family protein